MGVRKKTIKKYGVVSQEVAKEMAIGEAKVAKADVTVSITGIAGPEGGTEDKPIGLIYIGCFVCGKVYVKRFLCKGNRFEIRRDAVSNALVFLKENLL